MCTRTNDHAPVRRRPVPRVARSRRATPTPRAIPRRRRAIPRPRRASPRRRAVGFARVGFARVARGRGIQASRASRARFARRARDSRFATDRRVVSRAAGSRASTFASRSRSRVVVRGGLARVEARVAVAPTDRDRPTACSHCVRIRNGRPASRHRTVCPHAMAPCAKRRHPTPPRRARGDGSRRRRRRRRCSRSARRRSRPAARRWRRERARARREDAPDDARRRARGFRSTSSTAKSETTCLG